MSIEEISKLEQKHAELIAAANEMGEKIAQLKETKKTQRWIPEYRETYYYISSYFNNVYREENTLASADKLAIDSGNCFETVEKAKKHAKRLKVFNLLHAYADSCADCEENNSHQKYSVSLMRGCDGKVAALTLENDYGLARFDSLEQANRAIKLIGEDVIREAYK